MKTRHNTYWDDAQVQSDECCSRSPKIRNDIRCLWVLHNILLYLRLLLLHPWRSNLSHPCCQFPSSSGSESVARGPVPATLSGHGDNMCTSFAKESGVCEVLTRDELEHADTCQTQDACCQSYKLSYSHALHNNCVKPTANSQARRDSVCTKY